MNNKKSKEKSSSIGCQSENLKENSKNSYWKKIFRIIRDKIEIKGYFFSIISSDLI